MKTVTIMIAFLLLSPLAGAFAQDGSDQPEPFDMEGAIRKVGELLKESERLLVESLQPGASADEAAEKVEAARKAMDELLGESKKNGEEASKVMADIVKNAPQGSGGGSSDDQHEKSDDPKKEDGQKEPQDEPEKKDPKNSKEGDPESSEKSEEQPNSDAKKPVSAKDKPADPDLAKEWLATLPAEVRKEVENGNFDVVPPKWREVIRMYMKELAETDSGD